MQALSEEHARVQQVAEAESTRWRQAAQALEQQHAALQELHAQLRAEHDATTAQVKKKKEGKRKN